MPAIARRAVYLQIGETGVTNYNYERFKMPSHYRLSLQTPSANFKSMLPPRPFNRVSGLPTGPSICRYVYAAAPRILQLQMNAMALLQCGRREQDAEAAEVGINEAYEAFQLLDDLFWRAGQGGMDEDDFRKFCSNLVVGRIHVVRPNH